MDVIIPTTGNRLTSLENCVKSLKSQTQPVNITIVLAKYRTKNLKEIKNLCRRNSAKLLYEPKKEVKGSHRAVACNYGLQKTKSEFVGFVDDDVTVPPIWAESSLKYFKSSEVAGVTSGCKPNFSPFHKVQTFGSGSHALSFTKTTEIESVQGYNSIYRRSVIKAVGYFNERIGGCEDWELNYRIRSAGYKLLGIPEEPVEHRQNYTWKSFIKQMFGYGWSRARLFKVRKILTLKHAIPSTGLILIPLTFFFSNYLSGLFTGAYLAGLCYLSLNVGVSNLKEFFKTFLTFILMHISWALGYIKGLIY